MVDGVLVIDPEPAGRAQRAVPHAGAALSRALDRFVADDGLRAAVVTGTGGAFCAGLDLKAFAAEGADRRAPATLIRRFGSLPSRSSARSTLVRDRGDGGGARL
ncbi:hypothetical protein FRACA_4880002 [Frankia canadensis]|uniref:Enoyl-CoA hydratase n=1 Tax=Frankia canadensis TaxID=1836972 RepID=A0A2I2KY32_9ACTN|nr:hypothetical protein [Frankia canadensis]SNQ50567.1 hypothetical protein FRACA_4880002 [Frankia canadensis]SOU57857.1 hypothetical protein FRACA_4880002 [Frankia canadensis]